jgi:hypothetical protein
MKQSNVPTCYKHASLMQSVTDRPDNGCGLHGLARCKAAMRAGEYM